MPAVLVTQRKGCGFFRVKAQCSDGVPAFVLKDVEDFSITQSAPIPNTRIGHIKERKLF